MLLIWLLLPAVSAIIDCKSACELCQMDKDPATMYVSCNLCRKCHWALNPRRMMELQMPDRSKLLIEGQVLDDKQQKELKKAELLEFKDVLKDYGWKPEDLLVDKRLDDFNEDCLPSTETCLNEWESDEHDHHLKPLAGKKSKCKHATTCPPTSKTTRKCPPIIPCKAKTRKLALQHTEPTTDHPQPSEDIQPISVVSTPGSTDKPALRKLRQRILRQLVNLGESESNSEDDGCPPQPVCSDEESEENLFDKLVNKKKKFTPPPLTSTTTTETPCLDKPKCRRPTSEPCVPCMPQCPLPCARQMPMPFPVPFPLPPPPPPLGLPSQIPIELMQALMSLKTATTDTTTITEKEDEVTGKKLKKENLKQKKVKEESKETVSESSAESSEEVVIKGKKTTTEDDFLYLYVGVPKDIKNVRRG